MASSTKRGRKYRDKMKAAGLKPVTIWLPDMDAPGVKEQITRDIAIINASESEKTILRELGGIEIEGWK
jgi:Protein  of unknown function (DUF3018)